MKNIEENNKLIAEFMGLKPHHNDNNMLIESTENGNEVRYIDELRFDTNWNKLMPVVEKIEDKGYEVQIRKTDCTIFDVSEDYKYKSIVDISSGKKDSTHKAVVEFIKWYNNQKDYEENNAHTFDR